MTRYDVLWTNAHVATLGDGSAPYGSIRDGAVAARDGAIAWVGARADLGAAPEALAEVVVDCGGALVTPGIVDPHTHAVFAGDRIGDFERRIAGCDYASAAREGGGIAATVRATRACDDDALFAASEARVRALVRGGATTLEIKSGYGLDVDTELRMLRVARRFGETLGITVRATYLGAHVVPDEYRDDREAYLALVCETMIPRIARDGLADAVDVFCETGAFAPRETERVLAAARAAGLAVKVHAEQLGATGGVELAARYDALSADHLEYASEAAIRTLAQSGAVGVVLPGAYYYLGERTKPPIAALRGYGVPIALASDCNPGTSPICSAATVLNMACVLFGLTPGEALAGATRHAARALGLRDRGEIRAGARCDLALWDAASPAELCYWLGRSSCLGIVVAGRTRWFERAGSNARRPPPGHEKATRRREHAMSDMAIEYRPRLISVDDYHRMGEAGIFAPGERVELIDGQLIAVPPMGFRHGGTLGELTRLLVARLGDRATIRCQLPIVMRPRSEPEPDFAIVALADHRWLDRHPEPADVLLVIEVADSSRDFDLRRKAPLYARAGIAEYWVIDVVERRLVTHRDPRPAGYALTSVVQPGERISPLAFPADEFAVESLVVV